MRPSGERTKTLAPVPDPRPGGAVFVMGLLALLVPVLEVGGPVLRDRVAQAAAHVDWAVLFRHPPWMKVLPDFFDREAVIFDTPQSPLQPYEVLGLDLRRAPEVVVLMCADRVGQAVGGAEQMEGARLPVVAREDAGPRPLRVRKRPIDARHVRDELLPAELIAQALLERALVPDFRPGRSDVEPPLVGQQ